VWLSPKFSHDGQFLYFLFPVDQSSRLGLYRRHLSSGDVQLVAEPPARSGEYPLAEQLRRERERQAWDGITQYQLGVERIVIPYRGRLYLVNPGQSGWTAVPCDQDLKAVQLMHDERYLVGVMGCEMVRLDLETGSVAPLVSGSESGVCYGLAEYIAQEEFGRAHGFWIAPNDRWVAYTEVDERAVGAFTLVHWEHDPVWNESHRYPFVGQANARVRLWAVPLSDTPGGSRRRFPELDDEWYLLDVQWLSDERMAILVLSRAQNELRWYWWEPASGSYALFYREQGTPWINGPKATVVLDGERLLTTTERTGKSQVLVLAASGADRVLATSDVVVDIVGAHGSDVFVLATRRRALERTLLAVDLESGHTRELTPEAGSHRVWMSGDGRWWLDQVSTFDTAPVMRLTRRDDGATQVTMASPSTRSELGLPAPELFELVTPDGERLNGLLYRPLQPPAAPAPLVLSVYGGPHVQTVRHDWDETVDLMAQYLAQRGAFVCKVDGRGSSGRGRAFEQAIYQRFGDVELADQVSAVRWLLSREPIDAKRVGIYGWSYGGYLTIRALLTYPDVFAVGVAGAPVVDWRWYDTAYTERYLGLLDTALDAYDRASLLPLADRLQGHLLLIHGLIDENVHFRHTVRLIQAFIESDRNFDLLVLPASRHMPRGWATTRYRVRRTLEYFEQHLGMKQN
jgi:dipeptidyl-peptidase-4